MKFAFPFVSRKKLVAAEARAKAAQDEVTHVTKALARTQRAANDYRQQVAEMDTLLETITTIRK